MLRNNFIRVARVQAFDVGAHYSIDNAGIAIQTVFSKRPFVADSIVQKLYRQRYSYTSPILNFCKVQLYWKIVA